MGTDSLKDSSGRIHTGRAPWEGEDVDPALLPYAKECQRLSACYQGLGEGHAADALSQPSEGSNTPLHLDLRLVGSRTVGQYMSVV